jgi:hypothetical protein
MTIYNWPNGLGASLGDTLGTCKPLATSGKVWFVGPGGADGNNGGSELMPKETIASAISSASAGDIIVLMDGYTATISATLTLSLAGLTIVGQGRAAGKPTVKLTPNLSTTNTFNITGAGVALRNIWLKTNLQECSAPRVSVTGSRVRISDCYFECDAYEDSAATISLGSGSDGISIIDTTLVSTATDNVALPLTGITVTGAGISDVWLKGVTLDNGTLGWGNYYAADMSSQIITRLRGESVSLLRGADIKLNASTTGFLNAQTVSGAGAVSW